MNLIAFDGQLELEEDDWLDDEPDDDDFDPDACPNCGTELSEGYCPVCSDFPETDDY